MKYRYLATWFIILIICLTIKCYNDILYVILNIFYIIVASYKIPKRSNEIIKQRNSEVYEYYYQRLGRYSNWPMFISLILVIEGKYKTYKDLQDIMVEALIYCIHIIIAMALILITIHKL